MDRRAVWVTFISLLLLYCPFTHADETYHPAPILDILLHNGSATFYGDDMLQGNSGNCGFPWSFVNSSIQVAVPDPRWSETKTLGVPAFPGAACGQCFQVSCSTTPRYGNKNFCTSMQGVTVVVTNFDTPQSGNWPPNHFDFYKTGFAEIADPSAGIINVEFRRVRCLGETPKYTVGGHEYWHDVTVYDVPGPGAVVGVWARCAGSLKWQKLEHGWGAHWWLNGKCDFDDPGTMVRAQMAETGRFFYPKHVQAT